MQTTLNDFIIKDHGSLVGFYPTNAIGRTWWKDRVDQDCAKLGCFYMVERRYSRDIITGIEKDLED